MPSLKKTLLDLAPAELAGRRALVRVDFNVPLAGDPPAVRDAGRIEAALPTLEHLRQAGARLVLMSHLGRPKGKPDPALSLRPVARELSTRMGRAVEFVDDPTTPGAVEAASRLTRGGLLLVENLRFWPGETADDPAFAASLARLGDLYVEDAFGSVHRAHASTVGVPRILRPAVSGLLLARELAAFDRLLGEPERPYVAILGGAKISGKLETLQAILARADSVLVGGGMASTFYRAMGREVGGSLVEPDLVGVARACSILPPGGSSCSPRTWSWRPGWTVKPRRGSWTRRASPRTPLSATSARPPASASRPRWVARAPSSGTGRWASSRSPPSPKAPWLSRGRWCAPPTPARSRWWVGETRRRR